jgi:PAT family beta-lactamase induction signal transducer AmpG
MAVLSNGIISGVLSYLLRQQGVGIGRSSEIISLLILPQTIYFLWSPITDFWMLRRTWLIVGAIAAGFTMAAAFHDHRLDTPYAVTLTFLSACFGQLVVASCGGMMGTLHSELSRRRASSAYQGGSIGFGALGVFILAILALAWAWDFLAGSPPPSSHSPLSPPLQLLIRRWSASTASSKPSRASRESSRKPSCVGGRFPTYSCASSPWAAVPQSVGYMFVCLVNAVVLVILWLGPLTPATYFIGTTLYLFTIGSCYCMFTAVCLEFLGQSGKSDSGRYSIINSLGNVPLLT